MIADLLHLQKDLVNGVRARLIDQLGQLLMDNGGKPDGVYLTPAQNVIPSFAAPPFLQVKDSGCDFTEMVGKMQLRPIFDVEIYGYQRIYKDDYALVGSPVGSIGVFDLIGEALQALYRYEFAGKVNGARFTWAHPIRTFPSVPFPTGDSQYYQSVGLVMEWRTYLTTAA